MTDPPEEQFRGLELERLSDDAEWRIAVALAANSRARRAPWMGHVMAASAGALLATGAWLTIDRADLPAPPAQRVTVQTDLFATNPAPSRARSWRLITQETPDE